MNVKWRVAAFAEGEVCEIREFDNLQEAEGFCDGWSAGADQYGAASAPTYFIPDDLADMSDEERESLEQFGDGEDTETEE